MNHRYISLQGWIEKNFDPAGAPGASTVRKACAAQRIAAKKIGKKWYIDQHYENTHTGNALLDKIIN